jgi:hypothetical protein
MAAVGAEEVAVSAVVSMVSSCDDDLRRHSGFVLRERWRLAAVGNFVLPRTIIASRGDKSPLVTNSQQMPHFSRSLPIGLCRTLA